MPPTASPSNSRSIALRIILFFALGFIIGGGTLACIMPLFAGGLSYAPDTYQAVFLSNNQVYFGKLSKPNSPYPILSDVYYIQAFAAQDLSSTDKGSQLQLVKLGSELHQPQDTMYLNRSQILFIEPLKPDSKIVKAIASYKQNQTP